MSREQPQHQRIASTRRQLIGTAAKVALSLPLVLRPNITEANNEEHNRYERHDRWNRWQFNGRHSFGHRPKGSKETKEKTAQNCFLRGTKILNLVLEIILKSCTLSGDSSNAVVDQTGSLFEKVLRLIPSEDLTISGQACKLTESIIITSQTQQSLLAIMYSESCAYVSIEKNIFLRFANIWARILGRDDNLFNLCSTCGAAEAIVSLCRSHDDILVQIVAMELLIHFAKTSSGLQYLFSAGVIDWLVTVTSSEEDATLLGNQALRQLGDIFATSSSKNLISNKIWSAIDESIISRYMLSVRNYLDSRSEADRLTGDHNPPRVFLL